MIDLTKKFTIVVNILGGYYAEDSITSKFVRLDLSSLSLNNNEFEEISKSRAGYLRSVAISQLSVSNFEFASYVLTGNHSIYFVPIETNEQLVLFKLHGIFVYEILQNRNF